MAEDLFQNIIKNLPVVNSQINIVQDFNGSALFTQGDTKMFATAYGPHPTTSIADFPQALKPKGLLFVKYRPKVGFPTKQELLKELFIKRTLEMTYRTDLYPKTVVSVVIEEVEKSGGLTSCALNAAYLSLLNANITMAYPVAAVTSMVDIHDKFIIEPNHFQIKNAKTIFNFSYHKGSLLTSHTEGDYIEKHYLGASKICKQAAKRIFDHYNEIVNSVKY